MISTDSTSLTRDSPQGISNVVNNLIHFQANGKILQASSLWIDSISSINCIAIERYNTLYLNLRSFITEDIKAPNIILLKNILRSQARRLILGKR